MTVLSPLTVPRPDEQTEPEDTSLLRFIVCGSVDHGKSTLIGRLLYEAGVVFDDQLDALERDTRRHRASDTEPDFSLLLDGLAAEREQKITIDVAYRFFSTRRRKFIVADAPGHEQYTRNMATGASTADLALLLVSASEGVTRQTRRHALIVSQLGVRRFVIVVNKMDLIDWSQARFGALEAEANRLAAEVGVDDVTIIPVAARSGDNVVTRSRRMGWYHGPTLLELLERVETGRRAAGTSFRMPVQWVNRPNSEFRGYAGMIAGGTIRPGDTVRVLPAGTTTRVERIVTWDGDPPIGIAGQSVTLTFTDEVDASRGDVISAAVEPAFVGDRVLARFVWFGDSPLLPSQRYLVKIGTAIVGAAAEPAQEVVDLDSFRARPMDQIRSNEIGTGVIQFDHPVALDRYADNAMTGSFILIDPESFDTVGIGMVETVHPSDDRVRSSDKWLQRRLVRLTETHARSLAKAVSWRATGSLDTFLVALLITRNVHLAGGVALTEVLTKIFIYYLHERVWGLIPWGKAAAHDGAAS
jgi:sulfate adenylyltransferase large subunit